MVSEQEEIYDVEKIMGHRTHKGKKQYLIKWLGYPHSDNTWEYDTNIFCDELKAEYELEIKEKKEIGKKKPIKEKFRPIITNEWESLILKVIGVSKNSVTGKLEVEYETVENKKGVCSGEEMHIKAPVKLLEYYEDNLSFVD